MCNRRQRRPSGRASEHARLSCPGLALARGAGSFHGARGGELPLGSRLFGPGRECGPGAEVVARDVAAVGCVAVVRAVTVALRREAPRRNATAMAHAADGDGASLVVGHRPRRASALAPGRALHARKGCPHARGPLTY